MRLGIGRHWLARRSHKPVDELNAADELRVGRWLVLVVGVGVTASSLGIARLDGTFTMLLSVASTFAGPLLAVFLLGMFTRRTTATAALTTWSRAPCVRSGCWPRITREAFVRSVALVPETPRRQVTHTRLPVFPGVGLSGQLGAGREEIDRPTAGPRGGDRSLGHMSSRKRPSRFPIRSRTSRKRASSGRAP